MESTQSSRRGIFVLVAVLAISALLGGLCGPSVRATAVDTNNADDSVKSFTRVLSIVERNYADPIDTDKVIYDGAIPGMLSVLDPHSTFFDPKRYAIFKEEQQGRYYGVGMTITQSPRDNQTMVLTPFLGSPAYKAGIRPGDVIVKINDKLCESLTGTEVADLLKGPKGTQVFISLSRVGWDKPIEVTVTRDGIPRSAVEYFTMVKPGIGYVRVSSFNETTDNDVADALSQLDFPKLDGVIIDLRNNPGGLLNQAVGLADMFLDKNELVVSHHGRASQERRYYALRGNQGIEVPVIVMVNGGSASASEIVAGAIQDHDRGLVVGETSFGKGLVQTQFASTVNEETMLLLTTARYYTPSGRLIQRDYKNFSLYDYRYNPKPPRQPEIKLTDSGRQVFGQGGITPDVTISAPKLTDFQQLLVRRLILGFYPQSVSDFTRFYLGQKPEISKNFVVNDEVIAQFQKFLDQQHIQYTEAEIQANMDWIKWQIKREVFTSIFGMNEGFKVELQDDPQLDKAITEVPQARALYQNARKILAEREAGQPVHP